MRTQAFLMKNEAYATALKRWVLRHLCRVAKRLLPHVTIGRNIYRLRQAALLTQEVLAERAGVDLRSLQRIEAGSWNMTVDYLARFKAALRCKWKDLIVNLD